MSQYAEYNSKCWGEYKTPQKKGEELSSDLIKLFIVKSMKQEPFKIFQPCSVENKVLMQVPPECSVMDDTVLHTIKLQQYAKKISKLITVAEGNSSADIDDKDVTLIPEIPEPVKHINKHTFSYPFRYLNKTFSPFSLGEGPVTPRLSATNSWQLLRRSTAALIAHANYDEATEGTLDTLTDVGQEFLMKITRLLRVSVDQEALNGPDGFPDCLERVLVEVGVGSMTELHDFYQNRVLGYRDLVAERCVALKSRYTSMTSNQLPAIKVEIKKREFKEEEEEEEGDVPELHFPALGDAAEELQPSLKSGFQMLEQLQKLEPEEEINVSDVPVQEPRRKKRK